MFKKWILTLSASKFTHFLLPLALVVSLLYIRAEQGLLLFHTLVELFSIVVGVLMLVIVWNTRHFTRNNFLLYLGIGYFWVAVLDTWHTFSMAGFPFFNITNSEVTLHLWVYTRFIEALLLLSAPLLVKRSLNANLMLYGGGAVVALVVWGSFTLQQPVMLTAEGLTPFKVNSEYLIMIILLVTFWLYFSNREWLADVVRKYLLVSIVLTLLAEFSFTLYTSFSGISFVVGHFFKLLSFWMIYQAIVHTTLVKPFAVLASASSSYNAIPHPAVVVDNEGIISQVNKAAENYAGLSRQSLVHTHVHNVFHSNQQTVQDCELCQAIAKGIAREGVEIAIPQRDKWFLASLAVIRVDDESWGMVQLLIDITARKHIEQSLETSEARFRQLFEHTDAISVQGYDKNHRVIYWNPASEMLYGYTEQQAKGKQLEQLIIPQEMQQSVNAAVADWVAGGEPIPSLELTLKRADGSPVYVYSSHVMIKNQHNEPEMYCIDIDLTESRKVQQALEKQEKWLRQVLRTLPYGVQESNVEGVITYANEALHRLHGMPQGEMVGHHVWDFEVDEGKKQQMKEYLSYLLDEQPEPVPYITTNRGDRPGAEKTVEIIWDYQCDNYGKPTGFVSVISDITERMQAEIALRKSEERFQDFAETAADLFWEMDHKLCFSYVSGKVEILMDRSVDDIIGLTRDQLYAGQDFIESAEFKQHMKTIKLHKPFANFEVRWQHPKQGVRYIQLSGKPKFDAEGNFIGYRGVTRDITEKKQVEERMLHQAHFDSLTDLPNRFLSLDRLSQLLNDSRRTHQKVAVIFLDLDDFKKINDSLGHEIGDKLLIEAAQRLRHVVRKGDAVGRLGGDEFIILLGGLNEASDALPITESLLNQLRESFSIEGRELILSGSIGIAVYPQDGDNPSELLRNADSAMYHAKESGRNTYSFFTETMNQQVSRRLEIEEQIHGALGRGEFSVYYQPKIKVSNGQLIGAEALIRWSNPALGTVSPMEFIPIAEQTGLIVPIGQYVLCEALAKTRQWQRQIKSDFRMAVNLSPRQFHDPELVNHVSRAIDDSGVASSSLELEITEGVLMSGHAYIKEALLGLKKLGVSIAMDDFGTGYSSLSYLRNYPFDVLKIDQSFVRDITVDPDDRELINAAIAMAHSLQLEVVAEGVETEQQFSYLQQLGCDYLQGYLFGKPMHAEIFEKQYTVGDRT